MQALVDEIAGLVANIKAGTASLGEIEAFTASTAQLHERAVILRYKAYEAKVFGEITEPESSIEIEPETITEQAFIEPIVEITDETESFDLFSLDDEEEIEEIEEIHAVEEPIEVPVEPIVEETPKVVLEVIPEAEPAPLELEEEIAAPVMETALPETAKEIHPIYSKLVSNGDSLAARLMAIKLDALSGAFGLNERMQIIQELFKGSSEDFNTLVNQLDTIHSKAEARLLVSAYANQYSWDVDSNTALEFIQKTERLYA